jgi:hypothetical protein
MTTTDFDAIDALFSELGYGVSSADGEVGLTSETIEDVKAARHGYAEIGSMDEGEVAGHRYVRFDRVQVAKGQPRKDVVAIQVGEKLAFLMQ